MRDPITDAAQDPSCLLCLTPDRGGSWWSRLRPAMPRNFAADLMTWDSFQAMQEASDWTHDYTFECTFTLTEQNKNASIFYRSAADCMFSIYQYNTGQVGFFTNLLMTEGLSNRYIGFMMTAADAEILWRGRHTIRIVVQGETVSYYLDNELKVSHNNRIRTSKSDQSLQAPRSGSGYIYKSLVRDDTAGAVVWQAAYSDLYDTSNPWPSPVPRNFAEEPEAWRDLMAVIAAATETDWSFKIRYNLNSADGSQRIFSPGNNTGPIAVFWSSEGILYLRTIGGNGTLIQANPAGDPTGTHTVEIIAASGLYSIIYDGKTVHSVQDTPTLPRSSAEEVIQSGMNGTILYAEFSCGKAVWRYPTEAERVRLITKTNVRTDRGAFEAADETQPARVDTALDLRGKVSSYTVVVDFEAAEMDTDVSAQQLCGQGSATNMTAVDIAACMYYRQSSRYYLRHVWELAGSSILFYAEVEKLTGRHQLTAVLQINETSGGSAAMLYLDGKLIHTANNEGVPTGAGSAESFSLMDPANTSQTYSRKYGKVYSGLLFNRALSAAEIAALTPKKQPLSWAGIRDVVRRGRAQRYFAVGDVLTVATPRWDIEYEVTGFDQVEPADAALTHSMTLLPVRLVANLQFDAPEPGNPDANRVQYGCNRWDWSSIRQWMNSAAAPGEWWTAQHEYDAAPAYAATLAGFMADLPADFLSAVAPARLVTALPNVDGGGSVETVDRFWLPSRTEIFGDANNGVAEGVLMTKYVDATDADRIKQKGNGAADRWRLRSAVLSHAHPVYLVSSDGTFFAAGHGAAVVMGIVPACIIA